MPSQEDIAGQQELLAAYRRTLAQLLKQQALITEAFTPPAIANGIDEARANIRRIKGILHEWGVPADDLPDDEPAARPAPQLATNLREPGKSRIVMLSMGLAALGVIVVAAAVLLLRFSKQGSALQSALYWSQCDVSPAWILPGTIAPAQDLDAASKQIAQAISTKKVETWQVAGVDSGTLSSGAQPNSQRKLFMTISGAGMGKIDIHVFNKASITVTTQPGPQHADVVGIRTVSLFDCPSGSGTGVNRTVPPIELLEKMQQYTEDKQYTTDPFLALDSESSEVLVFPFVCQSPGTYTIQIGLRFRDNVRSEAGTYLSNKLATIVCPSSFTFWPITYAKGADAASPPIIQIGTPLAYHWDGKRYVQDAN